MAKKPVPVSAEHAGQLRYLIQVGVLEEIHPDRMVLEAGTIVVPCADGHHFCDFFEHHVKVCTLDDEQPMMHHPLSLNGGALLIPEDSPLLWEAGVRTHDDQTLLRHIRGALALKEAGTIILDCHAPCGMAGLFSLAPIDQLKLLVAAKDRLAREVVDWGFPNVVVTKQMRVYWPNGKRRSYHVHRAQWEVLGREMPQVAAA